jgi:hypothetical protein
MSDLSRPTLSFTCEFDERTAYEAEQKGWFECAVVTLPDGCQIALSFWDTTRLVQDLESSLSRGGSCFAEPALIIIPSITLQFMEKAVAELYETGYFDRLRAICRPAEP